MLIEERPNKIKKRERAFNKKFSLQQIERRNKIEIEIMKYRRREGVN